MLQLSSVGWEYDLSTVIMKSFNQDHLIQSPTREMYQASVSGDQRPTKSKYLHCESGCKHSEDYVDQGLHDEAVRQHSEDYVDQCFP